MNIGGTLNAITIYQSGTTLSNTYLALSGGTITGNLTVSGSIACGVRADFGNNSSCDLWFNRPSANYFNAVSDGWFVFRPNGGSSNVLSIGSNGVSIGGTLSITSSSLVSNLNADLLDGQHGSYYAPTSSLSSYLPLSGGTLTGRLKVNAGLATFGPSLDDEQYKYYHAVYLGTHGVDEAHFYESDFYFNSNGGGNYATVYINGNTVYHAGNSNKSSVPWSASSLTLNGAITGASTITASDLISVGGLQVTGNTIVGSGNGIEMWFNGSDTGYIIAFDRSTQAYNKLTLGGSSIYLSGNVGIETGSPQYKLDVSGSANATTLYEDGSRVITSGNIGSQNAGTATTLQTARSLWGQSFNGSSDVTGSISVSGGVTSTSNFKRAAKSTALGDLIVGDAGLGDDGIYYNSVGNMWFRIQSQSDIMISATQGASASAVRYDFFIDRTTGNVGIGKSGPSYKLDVSGDVGATTFHGSLDGNATSASSVPSMSNTDIDALII